MIETEPDSRDTFPQRQPSNSSKNTILHGVDFRALDDHGVLPELEALFGHFIEALDSLSEDNLNERAAKLASECQMLHPSHPHGIRGFEVGAFFMHFWTFFHLIARCIPHRHIGQKLLVQVFVDLDAAGQSTNGDWKGLPDLDMFTREDWISPTFSRVKSNEDVYTLQEWLNFNSFVARHYGTGFPRGLNLAVWEIRHGLEEILQERQAKDSQQNLGFEVGNDMEQSLYKPQDHVKRIFESQPSPLGPEGTHRVAVAAEWLIHASSVLLREALSWGTRPPLDDLDKRVLSTGSLFSGNPGLDLERWGFWKRRLNELRGHLGSDDGTRQSVDGAVASMSAAECAAAQHL